MNCESMIFVLMLSQALFLLSSSTLSRYYFIPSSFLLISGIISIYLRLLICLPALSFVPDVSSPASHDILHRATGDNIQPWCIFQILNYPVNHVHLIIKLLITHEFPVARFVQFVQQFTVVLLLPTPWTTKAHRVSLSIIVLWAHFKLYVHYHDIQLSLSFVVSFSSQFFSIVFSFIAHTSGVKNEPVSLSAPTNTRTDSLDGSSWIFSQSISSLPNNYVQKLLSPRARFYSPISYPHALGTISLRQIKIPSVIPAFAYF